MHWKTVLIYWNIIDALILVSQCTTIPVVFDWIQICTTVAKYVSVFWGHGKVMKKRIGYRRSQQCYKCWSPYKLLFWMRSPSSMSLALKVLLEKKGRIDLRSTMRTPLFSPWRRWSTHWDVLRRYSRIRVTFFTFSRLFRIRFFVDQHSFLCFSNTQFHLFTLYCPFYLWSSRI